MSITVALVDDHQLFSTGCAAVIENCSGLEVVGQAHNLAAGQELIRSTLPDVLVLDYSLDKGKGRVLIELVQEVSPATRILAVSSCCDPEWTKKAIDAGCHGVIDKVAEADEVLASIRAVYRGRQVISLSGSHHPTGQRVLTDRSHGKVAGGDQEELSSREKEVLALLARGLTNQQTADELFLSVKTIETYRSRVGKKLGVRGRSEMFDAATKLGLVPIPTSNV